MNKHSFKIVIILTAVFFMSGCQTPTVQTGPGHTLDVTTVLNQINEAIQETIDPNNKDFPPLTSVNLDLQVEVETAVNAAAKFPLVLTAGVKGTRTKFHQITLTFTPSVSKRTPSSDEPKSKLANAIRAVYQTVARPSNAFQLHNSIIRLQCTLKTEVDGGVSILGLVPITGDASESNQTIQTLTLNFGMPVPNRVMTIPQDTPAP